MDIMKKVFVGTITLLVGLTLFAQQKIDVISLHGKSGTTYQFTITGKNLDVEMNKFYTAFGKPESECSGETIWNNIEIPAVGSGLQLILTDGILTCNGEKSKFKPFKKPKDKTCQLKCLEENQSRQFILTVNDKESNIINNETLKDAVIKYLEKITQ
jgi:hypothetical protein